MGRDAPVEQRAGQRGGGSGRLMGSPHVSRIQRLSAVLLLNLALVAARHALALMRRALGRIRSVASSRAELGNGAS